MKRKEKPTPLRKMNQERALAHCAGITVTEWFRLDNDTIIELWTVFRAYILNGYKDTGQPVPARVADVWGRCKTIIDNEAGNE